MCILSKRAFGQNLEVLLVVLPGFRFISKLLLAHGETEAGHGVAFLVIKSFLVAFKRSFVVFAPEIKIADPNIFLRLHRVPGVEFLYAGGVRSIRSLKIRGHILTAGMTLGVVPGRAGIDSRIAARAFLRIAIG